MKKIISIILPLVFLALSVDAQRYMTRDAHVVFSSEAPLEKIEAENTKGTCVIDASTGQIQFAVLIKAFQFEKALMQEHFNENYLESDKYPKAIFKGNIEHHETIDFTKDGTYQTTVAGEMTIHGKTKPISTEVTFFVKGGKIHAESVFELALADYDIKIPAVVRDNIAKTVSVGVHANYEPLDK